MSEKTWIKHASEPPPEHEEVDELENVATLSRRASCSSRWPKNGESLLSAVAPGTAGVRLLVPSGLSYYPITHKKHLSVLS